MPNVGDLAKGRNIGRLKSLIHNYIYHACIGCGKQRWVEFQKGKPRSVRCYTCYGKAISIAYRNLNIPKETEVRFGQYGILINEGEKAQCHICGKWYIFLAIHAWRAHNYLADEYREQFGLGYATALISEDFAIEKGELARRLIKAGLLKDPVKLNSKEARDAGRLRVKGRKKRTEQILKNRLAHPRRLYYTMECQFCGDTYNIWRSSIGKIKSCGKSVCHGKALSVALKGRSKSLEHRKHLSEAKIRYHHKQRVIKEA